MQEPFQHQGEQREAEMVGMGEKKGKEKVRLEVTQEVGRDRDFV